MSLNPRRATFRGNVAPGARVKPSYLHGRWSSDDLNYLFHRQQVEIPNSDGISPYGTSASRRTWLRVKAPKPISPAAAVKLAVAEKHIDRLLIQQPAMVPQQNELTRYGGAGDQCLGGAALFPAAPRSCSIAFICSIIIDIISRHWPIFAIIF